MSDEDNRVAWPIVEAIDAAAVRLARENADLRAMLREIRRTVIASVRGEDHAASLTDDEVDEHAASTPVDVGNLVARMQRAEADRDAAQAIIAGRTTPPTIKQARAHSHGTRGAFVVMLGDGAAHYSARVVTGLQRFEKTPQRWWALDAEGRPCAWPVVEMK